MIHLVVMAGLILAVIAPIFFDRSAKERGRLLGMFFGGYLSLLGLFGTAFIIYVALFHGGTGIGTGIGRRTAKATFTFSEEPVAATLSLLVMLASAGVLTAVGWRLFKGCRDRTLVL